MVICFLFRNLEKDNYAMKVDELKEVISKYERDN